MRKIFNVFVLLILPILSNAFNHSFGNLTGYWYNARFDDAIRLKEKNDFIVVKGLLNNKRSIVFDQVGRNTFQDDCGNVIRIEDGNTIIYIKRKGREYFRFDRIACERDHRHNDSCNRSHYKKHKKYDDEDDDYYRNERGRRSDWNDRRYGDRHDNEDVGRHSEEFENRYGDNRGQSDYRLLDIEGTWQADHVKETIAILETRDGIRAKFSGSQKWVDYVQDKSRENEYIDSKGNRYILNGDRLTWLPSNKSYEKIVLRKINDEVSY